jgi:hypothetical protein
VLEGPAQQVAVRDVVVRRHDGRCCKQPLGAGWRA